MQITTNLFQKKFLPFLLFTFFFLIFLITSGGHLDPYDGVASFLISENLALTGSPSINFQTNAQSAEDLGFDLSNYLEMRSKLLYHEKFVSESLESENYTLKNYFTDQRIDERFLEKNENFFGPSYLPLPIIGSGFYHLS